MKSLKRFLYPFLVTVLTAGVLLISYGCGDDNNNNTTRAGYGELCGNSNSNIACESGLNCRGGGLSTPWRCQEY